MAPQPLHVDADRLSETLMVIVLLAFFLERALSLVFEHPRFIRLCEREGADLKPTLAFALAWVVCSRWGFDAISALLPRDRPSWIGVAITAAIIAGGSKGSLKLFHDVLDVKSNAFRAAKSPTAAPANEKI